MIGKTLGYHQITNQVGVGGMGGISQPKVNPNGIDFP
jgi:hypothetical protein